VLVETRVLPGRGPLHWLERTRRQYADRLVPVTAEIADAWGHLGAIRSTPTTDGLLAATALVHNWTLITRNVGRFERSGVRVVNLFAD
jgi:hypothetical protein